MSHDKIDKLARMANQIGEAFAAAPDGAEDVATHIRKFWTPKMIAETLAALDLGRVALNATSARAFARLRQDATKAG